MNAYPSIEAFYQHHPAARHSAEADYGCWWRDDDGGIWRVTHVHATGQVYGIRVSARGATVQTAHIGGQPVVMVSAHDADQDEGPVIVLATLAPWSTVQERQRDFGTRARRHPDPFEQLVPDWVDLCGPQGGLTTLVARLNELRT